MSAEQPLAPIVLEGERLFPESIAADAAGNIYIGTFSGTIQRALAGETIASPWIMAGEHSGLESTFGVLVDDARELLWVCSNRPFGNPASSVQPSVKAFALADGMHRADFPFPDDAGPVLCNDLAVAPADVWGGALFATDTIGGRIFMLTETGLRLFASDAALRGVDGIAFSADGTLYVNNVQTHALIRVERDAAGEFSGLTTLALSQPIAGPDALRPVTGDLFVQTESGSGRLTLVRIDGDRAEISVLAEGLHGPTAATVADDVVWVNEGKIDYLFSPELAGQDPGPFVLHAVPLPKVAE